MCTTYNLFSLLCQQVLQNICITFSLNQQQAHQALNQTLLAQLINRNGLGHTLINFVKQFFLIPLMFRVSININLKEKSIMYNIALKKKH